MDVFWKGYFTFADLQKRWGKSKDEINTAVMNLKLVPSYFIKYGQARQVNFIKNDNGDLVTDLNYPSEMVSGLYVYLRYPCRTSLTECFFAFGCEKATEPQDECPFWNWYEFIEPITSDDSEIVFLKSQVEEFERLYIQSAPPADNSSNQISYPWGNHNTNLLTHLSNAAKKFWSLYDPLEPSTAPTNEQVQNWLMREGVPKRTSEVMATILRADGLQTGRRK